MEEKSRGNQLTQVESRDGGAGLRKSLNRLTQVDLESGDGSGELRKSLRVNWLSQMNVENGDGDGGWR